MYHNMFYFQDHFKQVQGNYHNSVLCKLLTQYATLAQTLVHAKFLPIMHNDTGATQHKMVAIVGVTIIILNDQEI